MNKAGSYYYIYKDHLGSILTLTDESGDIAAQQSFDAWGRYRSPQDWDYDLSNYTSNPDWLDRGFTGHEMLREFTLINMNARIYDPIIARMLQPDNYVQDATSTQNYNRYSYVLNNPTSFIDPDGNNPVLLIVGLALLGGYTGGVLTNHGELNPIEWKWTGPGAWKTYAGIVGGGTLGTVAGWGISGLIEGSVSLSVALSTPAGGSILLYNSRSTFSSLQWTSIVGGPSIDWSKVDEGREDIRFKVFENQNEMSNSPPFKIGYFSYDDWKLQFVFDEGKGPRILRSRGNVFIYEENGRYYAKATAFASVLMIDNPQFSGSVTAYSNDNKIGEFNLFISQSNNYNMPGYYYVGSSRIPLPSNGNLKFSFNIGYVYQADGGWVAPFPGRRSFKINIPNR